MNFLSAGDVFQLGTLIVSIVGFIMLYTTLKLQAETFKEQQKISALEYDKFLIQIRPNFVKDSGKGSIVFDNNKYEGKKEVKYSIKLSKNIASEVLITSLFGNLDGCFPPNRREYAA